LHVHVEEKWPVLGRHERAAEWLEIWTNLGRAPRTIDAYARGLAEYLLACERDGVDPVTANRSQVAVFVRELATRPQPPGVSTLWRWIQVLACRTPPWRSGWCRSGCSTTS
jgi:hypothetical protein